MRADDPGTSSVSVLVGAPVWTRQFATDGRSASTETIGDVFRPTEQVSVQYQLTKVLQPGFGVQLTEAATKPPPSEPSRFTSLQFQPGMSFTLGDVAVLGVDAILSSRSQGEWAFQLGLQPRAGVSVELGRGWSFAGQLQIPVMLTGSASVAASPLVGVTRQISD